MLRPRSELSAFPQNESLALITLENIKGSGEPGQSHSLTRALAARKHKGVDESL